MFFLPKIDLTTHKSQKYIHIICVYIYYVYIIICIYTIYIYNVFPTPKLLAKSQMWWSSPLDELCNLGVVNRCAEVDQTRFLQRDRARNICLWLFSIANWKPWFFSRP